MKRVMLFTVAALTLLALAACRPRAATLAVPPTPQLLPTPTLKATAPAAQPPAPDGPLQPIGGQSAGSGFNGTFQGTLVGDGGSSAPATLTLTQSGNTVTGAISVGQGLVVDGGNCGQTAVPTGNVGANGQIEAGNANRLNARSMFNVQGLAIELQLAGNLSADGQTLTAEASIDLPMLCGRDPVISGTFARQ